MPSWAAPHLGTVPLECPLQVRGRLMTAANLWWTLHGEAASVLTVSKTTKTPSTVMLQWIRLGLSHRCFIGLGFAEHGAQDDASRYVSQSSGHYSAVFLPPLGGPLPLGSAFAMRGCVKSATVFGWVVHISWHPHELQDARFWPAEQWSESRWLTLYIDRIDLSAKEQTHKFTSSLREGQISTLEWFMTP